MPSRRFLPIIRSSIAHGLCDIIARIAAPLPRRHGVHTVPELPEVETVTRDLRPRLLGRRFAAVRRTSPHTLRQPWRAEWVPLLTGRVVREMSRRGKWIVTACDQGLFLLVHLGMTGQFTVGPAERPQLDHTHLLFSLDDGAEDLRFRDIRRFGCALVLEGQLAVVDFFRANGMGPEPFDLDPATWRSALAGTRRCLKAVLLDQSVVAGVGNIYADESLFRARLHPGRRACDLAAAEADRLREAIALVLQSAIGKGGSTIRDYVGGSGLMGGFQDEFAVYGRTGEPCPCCAERIVVCRLAGRSTHSCPNCQPGGSVVQEAGPS